MNNLAALKILLFAAAVAAAFSALYAGPYRQLLGLLAGAFCFAAFFMLFLCGEPEANGTNKACTHSKHHKNCDIKKTPSPSQEYAAPRSGEAAGAAAGHGAFNAGGAFISRSKEAELKHEDIVAQQVRVLNKFASTASHDLKNPLSSMKNIAYYFTNSVKIEGEVPNKMLKMLAGEVDRMNNMIVELLDSTRVKQLNKADTPLNAIIEAAAEKQKDARYFFDLNLQPLRVYADFDRMKQVFSSIFQNAKEAMPEGGAVTVKTYRSGEEAVIEISDSGSGMDEEVLAVCFDPMFSTKQARALGMSLTVSKQIVNMHGGVIKAESVKGKGSKFIINLPLFA